MMRRTQKLFALMSIWAMLASLALAQEPTKQAKKQTVAAAASNPVVGSGTPGQITKWIASSVVGDSNIFEDKFGKVGIGTKTPTSLLTAQGMIETTLGGYKFPDGTVQSTAGVVLVNHDASLMGDGRSATPLGIAPGGVQTLHLANAGVTAPKIANGTVVRSLNGLSDNLQLMAGANITITPSSNTLTIAAANALTGVAHDTTLQGDGTQASPLGVASPLEVRDLDNPARQPVQVRLTCSMENPQVACLGNQIIYTVPQGKRLVIEYASMVARVPEGQSVSMLIQVPSSGGGLAVTHYLPLSAPSHDGVFAGGPFTSIGQQVRAYADPGSNVVVNGLRNNGAGAGSYEFSISGHLVDIP